MDFEADVLIGRSPLRHALAECLSLGAGRFTTVVQPAGDAGAPPGFVQARWRRGRLSADLTYIAPHVNGTSGAAHVWQRLVSATCQLLGEHGTQRIYAAMDEDDRVALQVLRQLGFTPYTNDTIFRRNAGATTATPATGRIADADTLREPEIDRIHAESLPASVRPHEDIQGAAWDGYPAGGWWPANGPTRVYLDDRGVVQAAWRLFKGRSGLWLRLITSLESDATDAVLHAVNDARTVGGERPVYCAARGYEAQLNLALRAVGFEPVRGRFRMVKHTTVRILEPTWSHGRLHERGLDAAPTTNATNIAPEERNTAARRPTVGHADLNHEHSEQRIDEAWNTL